MPALVFGWTAVIILLSGQAAFAQGARPWISPSRSATPSVTDINVLRQQRVEIAAPLTLAHSAESRVLQLDLFADVSLRAVRERLERTASGVAWIGTIAGYSDSAAVFVQVRDRLVGHVYTPFGFFRFIPQPDGTYVVQQLAPTTFPPDTDAVTPARRITSRNTTPEARPLADDGSVVDLLVGYTSDALAGFGDATAMLAAIELAVAETNAAFLNTGVNAGLRLVRTVKVDYAESGDSAVDLGRLQAPNDGQLDVLHQLRAQHAADLVMLITERMENPQDRTRCGRAYVNEPNTYSGEDAYGFSIIRRSCLNDGRSVAHELGHNLGGSHDWYENANPGAFSYAKGFVSLEGRFMDVMAFSDLCRDTGTACAPILAYSTPTRTYNGIPQGVPVGTSTACTARNTSNPPCDADLGRAFTNIAPLIAAYRDSRLSVGTRRLMPGDSFRSDNGQFRLTYDTTGNLVLSDDQSRSILWASNTTSARPGQAVLQDDGNFVISSATGAVCWDSGTNDNPNAYLLIQDNGNLVIHRSDGQPIWDRHQPPRLAQTCE